MGMYLIDYKLLHKFQEDSFVCINGRNNFKKKVEKICTLLEQYIPQSKFEFINNYLEFNKDISTNPYNKALIDYSMNLIDMILKDKTKADELDFIAYHDILTGLKNKNSLNKMLNNDKQKHSLILLTIDNFSYVNTEYDSDFGDIILVEITKMLKNMCKDRCLYRINAVEFGILYKDNTNMLKLIKKIQKYFYKNDILVDDLTFHVSFTYGGVQGKYMLYRKASIALKEAKQLGKNRYIIYKKDEELEENYKITDFVHWNHIIHDALKNSTLVPFFQGVYDERKSKINTYEVLARIEHKDGHYLPHHFLEVAKLSGMLPKITRVMIEKSFAFMEEHSYRFSINITEEDLDENFLLKFLNKKAEFYNIEKDRLTLEILENISSYSGKSHISQLTELKKAGYKIAIDDFGIQYSNFERLLDLDIDYLKLDAKYIKNIDTDKKSQDIVKSIAMFAKKNNIPCIAEFVHNKKIAQKVKSLGIEYSQGYYYSKPNSKI
jgi:diguanylate cyclase (GGDEF)-like protein